MNQITLNELATKDLIFGDRAYTRLAANMGLRNETLSSWSFKNPNSQLADQFRIGFYSKHDALTMTGDERDERGQPQKCSAQCLPDAIKNFAKEPTMDVKLDHSRYPDQPPPESLASDTQKVDYLHRVVAAFDHGIVPDRPTLELLSQWEDLFDQFPLPSSPAYHALRSLFCWQAVDRTPWFGEPTYRRFDRVEGRTDNCETLV